PRPRHARRRLEHRRRPERPRPRLDPHHPDLCRRCRAHAARHAPRPEQKRVIDRLLVPCSTFYFLLSTFYFLAKREARPLSASELSRYAQRPDRFAAFFAQPYSFLPRNDRFASRAPDVRSRARVS